MAMSVPKAPGVSQMMKDGARVSKTQSGGEKSPDQALFTPKMEFIHFSLVTHVNSLADVQRTGGGRLPKHQGMQGLFGERAICIRTEWHEQNGH